MRCRYVLRALGVALLPAPALAQTAPPAPSNYALSWVRAEGAETCPPARALSGEIERRLGRPVFDPLADRGFEVEVTRFGAKYRSDVFVRGPAGEMLGHRTLESDEPGCGALLNATALAIALVIDPEAASREPPPQSSFAAFEPLKVPLAAPPVPAPALAPPRPTPPPPAPPPPAPAPVALGQVGFSLRGSLQLGLVPAAAPGVALAFSSLPVGRWGFAVQAELTPSRNIARGIGSLDVGLTRAAALVTYQLIRVERLRWWVGAGPSFGAFHVAVRQPAPVTAPGDYWFSAAQLEVGLQVRVTRRFFLELGALALASLGRPQFLVRNQEEAVWSQPPVSASLFGGVGTSFP